MVALTGSDLDMQDLKLNLTIQLKRGFVVEELISVPMSSTKHEVMVV